MALDLAMGAGVGGGPSGGSWEVWATGNGVPGRQQLGEAPGGPGPKNKEPPATVGAVKCEAAGLSVSWGGRKEMSGRWKEEREQRWQLDAKESVVLVGDSCPLDPG